METDLILGLAAAGATLGVVEGIKPGPLLTMVIRETLSGGLRAGLWTAAAPIFTDGPLVIVSLFAAAWIATNPMALLVISALGALFLFKMGLECFGIDPPTYDPDAPVLTGSFRRGVITNLLNPNVYVFWFLIGGPLMAAAADTEPIAPIAYALTFLVTIMLVKAAIAVAFDRARGQFSERGYKAALGVCGVLMLGFAAGYGYQAWILLAEI